MKASFFKTIAYIFCTYCIVCFTSCYGIPFRLGFEFQEDSGLCAWAINNSNIQKKELFSFNTRSSEKSVQSTKLWHLVIDTDDIEFVTRPFSDEEEHLLVQGIDAIEYSVNVIRSLFKGKTPQVTFSEWIEVIEKKYPDQIKKSNLFASVGGLPFTFKGVDITRPSDDWMPVFSPQVTIQHHLENSIFLFFGLLDFPEQTEHFASALPFYSSFVKFLNDNDREKIFDYLKNLKQKKYGFMFFHALTLLEMTPLDKDDGNFMEETKKRFEESHQVDAKGCLTLMSRRPFSEMFSDCAFEFPHIMGTGTKSYSDFFREAMMYHDICDKCGHVNSNSHKCNNCGNGTFEEYPNEFMDSLEVPQRFYKANYAQQFFDTRSGEVRKFPDSFVDFFKDSFSTNHREVLVYLLQNGIMSTFMLRNLKEELPILNNADDYFDVALKSVDSPHQRYQLIVEDCPIFKQESSEFDSLSPPWFLDSDDAMGSFKDVTTMADKKKYGEAIIEVRAITKISALFHKKMGFSESEKWGDFLRYPTQSIVDARSLFNFIRILDFNDSSIVSAIGNGIIEVMHVIEERRHRHKNFFRGFYKR